jgi:hypothetical protein
MISGQKVSTTITWERKGKRALIQALQERPQSKGKLKNILKGAQKEDLSDDAIRKKLERALGEFGELGLVEERDNKYCWYIYTNVSKGHEDYTAKLEHSRLLILGLERLAGFAANENPEDIVILVSCAESHLMAYPEIWGQLRDYREANESANRAREMFIDDIGAKMGKELNEQLMDPDKASRLQSFVGSTIPSSIYALMRYRSTPSYKIDGDEMWLGGSVLVARGMHLFPKIREFIENEIKDEVNLKVVEDIKVIESKSLNLQLQLQQEIRKLIIKIKSGEPLASACDTCPKVLFSPKTPSPPSDHAPQPSA